jgi:hypothetical protein
VDGVGVGVTVAGVCVVPGIPLPVVPLPVVPPLDSGAFAVIAALAFPV